MEEARKGPPLEPLKGMWPLVSSQDTVIEFRAHLNPAMTSPQPLPYLYPQRPYLRLRSHSEVACGMLGGHYSKLTTANNWKQSI